MGVNRAVCRKLCADGDAVAFQFIGIPALEGVAVHRRNGQRSELSFEVGAGNNRYTDTAASLKVNKVGFAGSVCIRRQCQREQELRNQKNADDFFVVHKILFPKPFLDKNYILFAKYCQHLETVV